jgi:hypothetical protein
MFVLMFKSRGSIAYMIMPVVFYLFIRMGGLKKYLYLVFSGAVLLALVILIKAYRWSSGDGSLNIDAFYDFIGYHYSILFSQGDLALIVYSKSAFEMCMIGYENCGGWSEFNKFIHLIFPFAGEVKSTAYLIWDYVIGASEIRGSLHALSYGIAFLDGSWFGVLYFAFLAFIRQSVLIMITRYHSIFIIGPSIYFALFFSRGSVYNGFIPLFFVLVISFFLVFFQKSSFIKERF